MKISIIIPTLNEEKHLRDTVLHAFANAHEPEALEVLVIDAGSKDRTIMTVSDLSISVYVDNSFRLQKHKSLNYGLQLAKGEIVLFLDADTYLPKHFDKVIQDKLATKKVVGGAFEMRFVDADFKLFVLSKLNSLRYNIWKTFYGDQAIFCKKSVAVKVGGFPDTLMEAAYFCRSVSSYGKLSLIHQPVWTSPRRFKENGFWKVLWFDIQMWIKFALGLELKKSKDTYWQTNLQNG